MMTRRTTYPIFILLAWWAAGCTPSYQITQNGVGPLKLGKPADMAAPAAGQWGYQLTDTTFTGNGFTWQAYVLSGQYGSMLVELDFLERQTINRLRVEDPRFSFKKRIRAGVSWGEVRRWRSNWQAIYLHDYGFWDVWTPDRPGIHLLFPGKADWTLATFPDSLRAASVVIM